MSAPVSKPNSFRVPNLGGDPMAAQQRVINALLEDLQDRPFGGFRRVDALRRERF